MVSPGQSGLSSAFRHSCSAASIFRASALITSHDYPTSLSSAASLGTLPLTFLFNISIFFLQILGVHTAVLPPVLCFLCMADRLVCLERYAARGHVPFLYLPSSDTRRAHSIYVPPFITHHLRRKTSRLSRGPKSFAALEPSAIPIHSQSYPCHPRDPAPAKVRN